MKFSFNWNRKDKSKPLGFTVEDCLSKEEADNLRRLDFQQVIDMETGDRIKLFTAMFGEQKAVFVNSRLENDVILKNQKEGLMNWINGAVDVEPKWRKEIIREISALDKALSKNEMDHFVEKIAELKFGVGVTLEEAQIITNLSRKAQEAKKKLEVGGSVAEYEKACKDLEDYVAVLKTS